MTFNDLFQNWPGTRTSETRQCQGVYKTMLLMFGIIIMYWIFLVMICGITKVANCDLINQKIDIKSTGEIGGWSLSHVFFYYFVGLLFPDCIVVAMAAGVAYEIFEELIGYTVPRDMVSVTNSNDDQYQKGWIRGSVSDVLYNFIGFVAGMLTTKYFLNGNPPKIPWLSTN